MDNRGDGIEEGQRVGAGQGADGFGERCGGQRSGRDDDRLPLGRRQAGHLLARDDDQRLGLDRAFHRVREADPVHGERRAGRHPVGVGRLHDERTATPHFLVQDADGAGLGIVGAKRVGAHELGQSAGEVGLGAASGAHLMDNRRDAGAGELPRGLGAGEAAPDDVDGLASRHEPASVSVSRCMAASQARSNLA